MSNGWGAAEGGTMTSKRGQLASLWSLVICLTSLAYLTAFVFTLSGKSSSQDSYYYGYNNQHNNNNDAADPEMAVTSRAMAFCALWTVVLAALLAIFGTVVLGWQSPTGTYYTCCAPSVHRTTPMALGSFIGCLIMFANLTLVCSVLFGEFKVRDYLGGEDRAQYQNTFKENVMSRSSTSFSWLCVFLTVLYAGFAAATFRYSPAVLEELAHDEREEEMNLQLHHHPMTHHPLMMSMMMRGSTKSSFAAPLVAPSSVAHYNDGSGNSSNTAGNNVSSSNNHAPFGDRFGVVARHTASASSGSFVPPTPKEGGNMSGGTLT